MSKDDEASEHKSASRAQLREALDDLRHEMMNTRAALQTAFDMMDGPKRNPDGARKLYKAAMEKLERLIQSTKGLA